MNKRNLAVRMLSGMLSTVMTLSVAAAPVSAWAAEPDRGKDPGEYVSSLPELEDIRDRLDKDEIVEAKDREIEYGADIDLAKDFAGITIPDGEKVNVTFYEAKNAEQKTFSTTLADTYKAVYYAEPVNTDHPAYRFDRKVIVKENPAEKLMKSEAVAADKAASDTAVSAKAAKAAVKAVKADSGTSESASEKAPEKTAEEDAESDSESDPDQDGASASTSKSDSGKENAAELKDADKDKKADSIKTSDTGEPQKESVLKDSAAKDSDLKSTEGSREEITGSTKAGSADSSSTSVSVSTASEPAASESAAETATDTDAAAEKEIDTKADDPYGGEDGWTTAGIIKWATEEENISLAEMGVGETVTFEVPKKKMALKSASTGTMKVEITKGERYHFYDYGLGTFWTHPYYVKYGNITATAYCIEPSKSAPDSGTYTITKMKDSKTLAKVCYYGTKYSGDEGFFAEKYPEMSAPERFIITHLAAGYANEGEAAFRGTSDKGKKLALEMYNYCQSMPDIPDVDMELTPEEVAAYVDGSTQRTKEITFKADKLQTVTFKLPSGVKLHNVTTGSTSAAGASVEIPGGTKFYFSAPLNQAQVSGKTWHSKLNGSITKDYSAYMIAGGSDEEQDLALVFGEAVNADALYVELTVTWVENAKLTIKKTNAAGNKNLSGAVYGLYSDKDCTELITKLPATDANGTSTAEVNAAGTAYLKEITAPKGFKLSTAVTAVTLTAGTTVSKSLKDDEIMGSIKVTKQGQVLTGATTDSNGTTFKYENDKLAGAAYSVSAGADITSADGTVVHKKGASVGTIKTGNNGEGTLGNLHMGTYVVTETGAPTNYVNKGESKTVTLTAGSTSADVTGTAAFSNDRQKVEITAVKQDKLTQTVIAGAVYGLYADADIKNKAGTVIVKKDALIGKVTTGSDGKGKFSADLPVGHKFYVKELTAPTGYKLNGTDTYHFTTTYTNDKQTSITFSHTFTNEEIRGKLTIYKEGEVLTGADVTDAGTTFKYETRKQKGATFAVYAGADIKSAGGKSIYKKGDLIKDGLTTGDDGSVVLDNLYLGTYTVKETGAPKNFFLNSASKDVTLSLASLSGEVVLGSATIKNERQKAKVTVTKQDATTKNPLPGGVFGLYAGADIKSADGKVVVKKDTFIEKITTGADGTAVFRSDLPVNNSWYVREIQAPKNYYRNQTDTFKFTFNYTNEKQDVVSFTHTFVNERVDAQIDLTKVDAETGVPQGDAKLEKAVYGLFARENITHPDGKTGILYKAGAQVATFTTDKDGKAHVEDLYLGKYFIKELIPSEGYLLDEKEYDIDCAYEGDLVKTVKKTCTSKEQVIKQPFQVIKAADNDKTDADLLQGAGFSAYLISSLKTKPDGSYDFIGAKPIVLTADGKTEMFTDKKGHAVSIPIPYGKYIVRETTTPHNFIPVDDFKVTITENHPATPQQWRVLLDDEFEAKLKVIKKDDETKKSVLIPGTEFKVYDMKAKKYVEQVTTYPSVKTHTSFFTDENGYLILPNNLKIGRYRIEEVTAPPGYVLNHDAYEIDVDTNTAYQIDQTSGDAIIEVEVENPPVKGRLHIEKTGEVLTGFSEAPDAAFGYETRGLAGAEYAVYAAEDIYTPDFQRDENGDRIKFYEKDALVTTVTTDETGTAEVNELPLGTYRVVETKAPEGFVLNTDPEADSEGRTDGTNRKTQVVTFEYLNQETPVIEQALAYNNDRQKVELTVEKQDAETGKTVAGAVFGLYTAEDIHTGADTMLADAGQPLIEADTLLAEAASDENGLAAFDLDLPLGRYYVKEHKAPDGYVTAGPDSDEILTFDASYQGQEVPVVKLTAVKKNIPTKVEFTKSDITTAEEVDGAVLTIYTRGGDVVERWTTVKGEPHMVRCLTAGESYVLREETAPYGYLRAEDVVFTVEDTGEIQKVKMEDKVPTALLIINKRGEFLDKVTPMDAAAGTIGHLFEYLSGDLTTVTFEVYAAEDIKAADGIAEDYFKKDQLIGTITTDDTGIAKLGDLPVGKYYVKEKETAHGFVLDSEPRYIDLSYRDQYTPIVVYDEKWQNARQKVSIHLVKKETAGTKTDASETGTEVTEDPAENTNDSTERETTEEITGETVNTTGSETEPGNGTETESKSESEAKDPAAEKAEAKEAEAEGSGSAEKEAEIRLKGAVFGLYTADVVTNKKGETLISGDTLIEQRVTDANGEITFTADLPVDGKYYVKEIAAPDGYVTSGEKKEFTFSYEGSDKKTVIFDFTFENSPTTVELSKADVTTCKEIPGAHLEVTDKDGSVIDKWTSTEEPHIIKKLVVGKTYYMTERIPANGYATAETIEFTIENTADIQKVQMFDEPTKVLISKTDITTCEEIPGAKLTIFDKDGKVVRTWTSGKKPTYIEKLPIGDYVLREELAPDGYVRAEDVKFTVKDTGIEQKVEMKDKYTRVQISKHNMTTCKEIPDAHLTIFDKDGKVIEKWTSTEEPHMIERLPVGEYMLREELAPDGYVRAEDVKFKVEETGEIQKVYMKDDYTKVSVSKQDMTTCKEIPGAHLTLFDKDGKVVEKWTSTDKPHYITMLKPGRYMLREELAPDGYLRAEDVKFTVEETGDIQKVYMKDAYTKVQISKTDMVTKEEIPGAKLTVFDKDGKKVTSWTSTKKPHMIERLAPGQYTLREELAPDGYLRAEDVKFTVKETGEIQKVAMVDDYTKVQISKTDMVTKKELPGAKLTVFDSNNETVAKWTSGKEPHMIEKLKPGTYTLREETAPNGYEVAEDVKFTVKETGEIQKVSMVDAPKGTKKTTTSGGGGGSNTPKGSTSTGTRLSFSNPETGDTTDIVLWVLLLGLGGIFAAALWYAKKRVEEDTKKD